MSNTRFTNSLAEIIHKSRLATFGLTLLAIAAAAFALDRLNIDLSLGNRFFGEDEATAAYMELLDEFGPEASLLVVAEAKSGSVWDTDKLKTIGDITCRLETLPGVRRVTSIAGLKGFDVPPEKMRTLPIVSKLLVSHDSSATAILIEPSTEMLAPKAGVELARLVNDLAMRYSSEGLELYTVGPLALQSAAIEYSRRDLKVATLVAFLAVTLVLGVVFRSWWAVAGPMIVAAGTALITLGIMAAAGVSLSQFALIALPVSMGLCVLDSVHIVDAFVGSESASPRQAIEKVLAKELAPCFWTSATTLIGFAALVASPIEQVHAIGLVIAVSVPISFILSFTFLLSLLSMGTRFPLKARKQERMKKTAWAFSGFIQKRRVLIVFSSALVMLPLIFGVSKLKTQFDFPHIFFEDAPIQLHTAAADAKLGGSASLEILLHTEKEGGFKNPEVLKRVASFCMALGLAANVSSTVSILDIGASAVIAAGHDTKKLKLSDLVDERFIEETANFSSASGLLDHWLSRDAKTTRIHVKLNSKRPELHESLQKALKNLKKSFSGWFEVKPTGFAYLYKSMERLILDSFRDTFAFALIGVMLALLVIARSARLGSASVLANLMPIGIVLGIMGYVGTAVSVGLVIIPAVGLGLIADDTIHFLIALKRAGGNGREAVARALEVSSRPIVVSQLILIAVFASLLISSFISNVILGAYMILLFAVGLVFDLLFVPAIAMMGKPSIKN